uniref:Uncharacterized protein n=1 Tax=Anguilla anguilla TaxID=7936 RepID=A0A0E9VMC6_ANGAN
MRMGRAYVTSPKIWPESQVCRTDRGRDRKWLFSHRVGFLLLFCVFIFFTQYCHPGPQAQTLQPLSTHNVSQKSQADLPL